MYCALMLIFETLSQTYRRLSKCQQFCCDIYEVFSFLVKIKQLINGFQVKLNGADRTSDSCSFQVDQMKNSSVITGIFAVETSQRGNTVACLEMLCLCRIVLFEITVKE